jgi:hypothetical protein
MMPDERGLELGSEDRGPVGRAHRDIILHPAGGHFTGVHAGGMQGGRLMSWRGAQCQPATVGRLD